VNNPASQEAQARLLHWNYLLERDSVPAGVYEMWQRYLQINVRELMVPAQARAFIGMPQLSLIIDWLQAPDGRFGPDPIVGRNAILVKSLDEAVADLTRRLGPKMDVWKLGAYHHATIHHLLTGALNAEQRAKFDVGDMPRGGDSYTVSATGGEDNQTTGASFKMLLDTENWDNSVGMNNPGQSGDVNNPHYRDLNALWGKGKYFPIFYSRDKINSVAENVTLLEPAK
jgi:penicillin amidase